MELLKNIFKRKTNGLIVLMYHRIADMDRDPWQMAVSPDHFEQHLRMLENEFEIISISEMIDRRRNKDYRTPAVAISFDDAYADNFEVAAPLLKKYDCPASFFVSSAFLNNHRHFWWDELESCLLHSFALPEKLKLNIGGHVHLFTFSPGHLTQRESADQNRWNYTGLFPTDRCLNFFRIWKLLKPLAHEDIEEQLEIIKHWVGTAILALQPLPRIMNSTELSLLADDPLFSIGVHTRNHPALAFQNRQYQEEQIAGCKADLEHLLRTNITTISYPYGLYNDDTLEIGAALDFEAGFTIEGILLNHCKNPLKYGRIAVTDISVNGLKDKLAGCTNFRSGKYERRNTKYAVRSEE